MGAHDLAPALASGEVAGHAQAVGAHRQFVDFMGKVVYDRLMAFPGRDHDRRIGLEAGFQGVDVAYLNGGEESSVVDDGQLT